MTANAFIYGAREDVARYAKSKRWRANGRASLLTRSDVCVHFLAFEEQLTAVGKGERVYLVGQPQGDSFTRHAIIKQLPFVRLIRPMLDGAENGSNLGAAEIYKAPSGPRNIGL